MIELLFSAPGRGAWPDNGRGGTLTVLGTRPGAFYRAPEVGSGLLMPGQKAKRALRAGEACHINDWAVYRAVVAWQRYIGVEPDGIWGPATGRYFRAWQAEQGLPADGVLGPRSARRMLDPIAVRSCRVVSNRAELLTLVRGHVGYESGWDVGAVGGTTPNDLGLGQINGPSHPELTVDERLNPDVALPWVARFVYGNLQAMSFNLRDAVAAYNLGKGGARSWISAGRPDVWHDVNVKRYIDAVLAHGQT